METTSEAGKKIRSEANRVIAAIEKRKPSAIRFVVTPHDVNTIALLIETKRFNTMLAQYGHGFVTALLSLYEDEENYEACGVITKAIEEHNTLVNDTLSTR